MSLGPLGPPLVTSLNHSLCSSPRSHRLKAFRIWFSTPGMWTAFISNSHMAATNSSSLRHSSKNALYALPVLSSVREVSLSKRITIRIPCHFFPQTFAATTTVSNSSALILNCLFLISSGNSAWNNYLLVSNHAPQPLKQVSVAIW